MPLYSYKKATTPDHNDRQWSKPLPTQSSRRRGVTVGQVGRGLGADMHRLLSSSKLAAIALPGLLMGLGAYIIYQQLWPTLVQTVREQAGFYTLQSSELVAGEYISVAERYSNPGSRYFAELKNSADAQNLLFNDNKSNAYQGRMKLSIGSLSLNNLNVEANTDSSVEEIYDRVLEGGLAHFAGTSLPFSELDSYNTVVYGHSSAGDYYQRTKDPAAAFSVLSEIRYGSDIKVELEGKTYVYKVIRTRVVDANDLSILRGQRGQKLLTLLTCFPNGNNAKRLVVTARLVEV